MTNNQQITPNTQIIIGDMFTTTLPAFGHGVNCQGVMGSGIAKIIKNKWPEVFPPYKKACLDGTLQPGGMLPVQIPYGPLILNLASQDLPGANASYTLLEDSLIKTFDYAENQNLKGFALPRIGAGIGGLEWTKVIKTITNIADFYPNQKVELWVRPEDV
jgi:O-acetyl-ADP-ribose deacetylase (regulator of RNase III)